MDSLDYKILSYLTKSKRLTYAELSGKLFVSLGTIHQRIKKMEQKKIITGLSVSVDYKKLNYEITAFLGIYLQKSSLYDDVIIKLKNIKEVLNAHYTTGRYSIFVTIVCKSMEELRNILHDKVQTISGVERTETIISLECAFDRKLAL